MDAASPDSREHTIETSRRSEVVVVGSANSDYVVYAHRLPRPGETVLGDGFERHAGGKGLNQAVAAAGIARTAFVGTIGDDAAGEELRSALRDVGVDTSHLRVGTAATGIAVVHVSADAENSITVIAGANDDVDGDQVFAALDALTPRVVVTQLETPLEVAVATARWAESRGARWMLNPSPIDRLTRAAPDHPLRALVTRADPLIVNAGEARAILDADDRMTAADAAVALSSTVASVVVTDGSRGCHAGTVAEMTAVAAERVAAVDTTGAGDAFAGVLAARLATGATLAAAAREASHAAALVVSASRGARR